MFRTKGDVERHVQSILRKVKNEQERNLRCYNIAQLYYKVHDYDSAKKYVTMYIFEKNDSAVAYKLLGQACEGLNQKTNALSAYKKSLELEANQTDLVLKICELLCDNDIDFDSERAKYWSERAATLFPHSPAVFKLKEKLMTSDSNITSNDREDLLVSELRARPNDVSVRIKLVKLYVDSGRVAAAYNHTLEIEARQVHNHCLPWYQCINHICKVYFKDHSAKCDWEFYIHWLSALNRVCSLTLNETSNEVCDIVEAADAIFNLDQTIHRASEKIVRAPELYNEFFKHISAQLAFHFAVLLMKRAKKDNSIWKETRKIIAPLLLLATSDPPNCDSILCLSIKDTYRKFLINWSHEGLCRLVQAAYILHDLSKDQTHKTFIDKVNQFASNDWRKQIFKKTFLTGEYIPVNSSHFVTSEKYLKIPQSVPSLDSLKPSLYVSSFELHHPSSLHHLVWLGLRTLVNPESLLACRMTSLYHLTSFKSLQFTVKNLNNSGVETLNQLDIESFLYATAFCTAAILEEQKTNGYFSPGRPNILPADITPSLCTPDQAKWWVYACNVKQNTQGSNGGKMSDIRHSLQKGIEAIRGDDLSLPLLVHLARVFAERANEAEKIEESDGCDARALHLWQKAYQQLEQHGTKDAKQKYSNANKFFDYPIKDITTNEVNKLIDEARYFIACHHMKNEDYEQAVELLKPLRSVEATYNLALIHQSLAEEQTAGLLPNQITPEVSVRHSTLLTKAKEYLHHARDMLRNDYSHPMYDKISSKISEIDDVISQANQTNGVDTDVVTGHLSFGSEGSPLNGETIHKIGTPFRQHNTSRNISSSTPNRNNYEFKHRNNCAELVELVSIQQSNSQLKMQQLLEQTRLVLDRIESISFEQRSHRGLIEELTHKFNGLEVDVKATLSDIKKEVKKQDIYNVLDDEDYSDEMLQYHNYQNPYYPTQRPMPQNSAAIQFANAAVPSYISPRAPDPLYQANLGFYNQATLPLNEPTAHSLQDLLRAGPPMAPQVLNQKLPPTLTNPLAALPAPPLVATPLGPAASLAAARLPAPVPAPGLPPTLPSAPLSMSLNLGHPHTLSFPSNSAAHTIQKFPVANAPQFSNEMKNRGPTNVVITTSDTLPTGTPPVQPTLSVTIPPQHRLGDSAAHQFQIQMPSTTNTSTSKTVAPTVESDDDASTADTSAQEYDPIPDFKPLVSLPELKEIVTGEEKEDILFECRAKLYRFVDGDWKERGLGVIKILKDKTENKARILMRREKIHKICANHFLTPGMSLTANNSNANSWMWAANDFADEKVQMENLCVKFKTKEESEKFKDVFNKVIADLSVCSDANKSRNTSVISSTPNSAYGTPIFNRTTPSSSGSSTPNLSFFSSPKTTLTNNASTTTTTPKSSSSLLTPPKLQLAHDNKPISSGSTLFSTGVSATDKNKPFSMGTSPFEKKSETSLFSNTITAAADTSKISAGGFTFMAPPKFKVCEETKTPAKPTVEEKKPENLFANFTFSKSPQTTSSTTASIFSKPAESSFFKAAEQKSEVEKPLLFSALTKTPSTPVQTKTGDISSKPLFPSSKDTPNFGSLANSLSNTQEAKVTFTPASANKAEASFPTSSSTLDFSTLAKSTDSKNIFASPKGSTFQGVGSKVFGDSFQTKPAPFDANVKSNSSQFFSTGNIKVFGDSFQSKTNQTKEESAEQGDGDGEEFVPTAQFAPVIPLPKEVEVVSGEEGETVLFEERAKIYRFCTKESEWKERGIGKMKILKNEQNGVVRLVMRREQVFKVCCNHRLTKDMDLTQKSENMLTWPAKDFSEDAVNGVNEMLCIRFKHGYQAAKFKEVFLEAQANLGAVTSPPKLAPVAQSNQPPLSSLVKHQEGSWECSGCLLRHGPSVLKCSACNTPNPKAPPATVAEEVTPAFSFGMPSFGVTQPQSAETANVTSSINLTSTQENKEKKSEATQEKLEPLKANHKEGSLECTTCYVRVDPGLSHCQSCNTPVGAGDGVSSGKEPAKPYTFGMPSQVEVCKPSSMTGASDKYTFGISSSGFSFGVSSPAQGDGDKNANQTPLTNKSLVPSGTSPSQPLQNFVPGGILQPNQLLQSPQSQSSASPSSTPNIHREGSLFSTPSPFAGSNLFSSGSGNQSMIFGSNKTGSNADENKAVFNFGSSTQKQPLSNFTFGSATFQFSMNKPSLNEASPKKNESGSENEGSDHEEDEGDHIYFPPVIELPDKVEVKTGEEDESVIFSHRAKLFRFAKEIEGGEWKERGLGDVKILKHNSTGKIRLLMRREKVMKLCLNHYITAEIKMEPKDDEKSLMWDASDFSEGTVAHERFAIRFKNKEIRDQFLEKFNECQVPSDQPLVNASADESDDLEIVYELRVSDELRQKALALKLPPNFYAYLDRPKCPGCAGCEPDDDDEADSSSNKDDSNVSKSLTTETSSAIKNFSFAIKDPIVTSTTPGGSATNDSTTTVSSTKPFLTNTFSFNIGDAGKKEDK